MQAKADDVVAPLSVAQSLVVASVAGGVNVVCTNPVWVAVTRMQTASKNEQNVSFFDEIQAVYNEAGLRGLWRVRFSRALLLPSTASCCSNLIL